MSTVIHGPIHEVILISSPYLFILCYNFFVIQGKQLRRSADSQIWWGVYVKKIYFFEQFFFMFFGMFHLHRIWGLVDRIAYADFWMNVMEQKGWFYFGLMSVLATFCVLGYFYILQEFTSKLLVEIYLSIWRRIFIIWFVCYCHWIKFLAWFIISNVWCKCTILGTIVERICFSWYVFLYSWEYFAKKKNLFM